MALFNSGIKPIQLNTNLRQFSLHVGYYKWILAAVLDKDFAEVICAVQCCPLLGNIILQRL